MKDIKQLLFIIAFIQFVIQAALWLSVREYVTKSARTLGLGRKGLGLAYLALNIAISFLVVKFTNAGMIAGVTNLFASAVLGAIMSMDAFFYKENVKIADSIEKEADVILKQRAAVQMATEEEWIEF
jgi:hypothetical protein